METANVDRPVETPSAEREVEGIGDPEIDRPPRPGSPGARGGDRGGREIHAGDLEAGPIEEERVGPGPAAHVEDAIARGEPPVRDHTFDPWKGLIREPRELPIGRTLVDFPPVLPVFLR